MTYLEAVDIVCLDCLFLDEEVCEKCPVRKTVDRLSEEYKDKLTEE